ncbi:transporter substrate-binding domain-containing protein [Paraglaciecola aquimarina]|uniref:Transporter substrate-binding domain-containing protein n=1 Tax=Paraglaciecola aquimarina TaxID=1235557 RepID=A0ABU3T1Q3_9ALTE|nr:transporter substrate-binding domain-containing protein [Paraglaciecola aquimarina]MDU0356196.1 transporter substrate-binding domain-containing protein [Paraglaciecola aquimarina]
MRIILFCIVCLYAFSAKGAELDVYIAEYPPFQILDENNGHTGFSVELFKEIVKLTDLEVEYIAVPWVRALDLVAQEANSIVFTMARTPEREKLFTWVDTIHEVSEGVFSLKDREDIVINNLEDVYQYSIALPRGDVALKRLKLDEKPPRDTLLDKTYIVEQQEQCIKMLTLGRVDLNFNNNTGFFVAAKMLGYESSHFKQVFVTGQTEMGIAANKNTDANTIRKIRLALATLKSNGVFERLERTWFGEF